MEHGVLVHCSGGEVIELPFQGLDSDFSLLYMIVKRGILFILTGGRICRSKFRTDIVGLCFYTCLGVGLLVDRLPLRPGLVPFRALFPIIIGARKSLTCEQRRTGKYYQGLFGNCLPCPAGLPLRVLDNVYVLGDALDLEVVALHFIM